MSDVNQMTTSKVIEANGNKVSCKANGPEDGSNSCIEPDCDPDEPLEEVTCACGHGYFNADKRWVSGYEVRSGLAPPKPSRDEEPNHKVQSLIIFETAFPLMSPVFSSNILFWMNDMGMILEKYESGGFRGVWKWGSFAAYILIVGPLLTRL